MVRGRADFAGELLAGQLLLTRSRSAGGGHPDRGCGSPSSPLTRADLYLALATIADRGMQLIAKASRGRLKADHSNLSLVIYQPLPIAGSPELSSGLLMLRLGGMDIQRPPSEHS
jgi:hypothetical protein